KPGNIISNKTRSHFSSRNSDKPSNPSKAFFTSYPSYDNSNSRTRAIFSSSSTIKILFFIIIPHLSFAFIYINKKRSLTHFKSVLNQVQPQASSQLRVDWRVSDGIKQTQRKVEGTRPDA